MSKIRHPNLVALLGFSSDGPEHLLVYELMHNGSLHDQLHGMLH
jgi:serine/threonine protein kinase